MLTIKSFSPYQMEPENTNPPQLIISARRPILSFWSTQFCYFTFSRTAIILQGTEVPHVRILFIMAEDQINTPFHKQVTFEVSFETLNIIDPLDWKVQEDFFDPDLGTVDTPDVTGTLGVLDIPIDVEVGDIPEEALIRMKVQRINNVPNNAVGSCYVLAVEVQIV